MQKVNNLEDAIKVLSDHQKWRRGADMEMSHPKDLGIAIDIILESITKKEKGA